MPEISLIVDQASNQNNDTDSVCLAAASVPESFVEKFQTTSGENIIDQVQTYDEHVRLKPHFILTHSSRNSKITVKEVTEEIIFSYCCGLFIELAKTEY